MISVAMAIVTAVGEARLTLVLSAPLVPLAVVGHLVLIPRFGSLGAASVIEAAGRRDIVIVGFDATAEAQDAIRKGGALKADISQYPRRIGQTVVQLVARHLRGEQVPAAVPVEVSLVNGETLKQP